MPPRVRFSERFLPSESIESTGDLFCVGEDQVVTGLDLSGFLDEQLFASGALEPTVILDKLVGVPDAVPGSGRSQDLARLRDLRMAMEHDGGRVTFEDLSFLVDIMRDESRGLRVIGGLVASKLRDVAHLNAVVAMADADPTDRRHWAIPLAALAAGGGQQAWLSLARMASEGGREDRLAAIRAVAVIGLSDMPDGNALAYSMRDDPDADVAKAAKEALDGRSGVISLLGTETTQAIASMGLERMAIGADLQAAEAIGDSAAAEALRVLRNELDANLAAASEAMARSSMEQGPHVPTTSPADHAGPQGEPMLIPADTGMVDGFKARLVEAVQALRQTSSAAECFELSSRIGDYRTLLLAAGVTEAEMASLMDQDEGALRMAGPEDASTDLAGPAVDPPLEGLLSPVAPPPAPDPVRPMPGWSAISAAISAAMAAPWDDDLGSAALEAIIAHGGQAGADGAMWIMHAGPQNMKRDLMAALAGAGDGRCLDAVALAMEDASLVRDAAKVIAGVSERCGASRRAFELASRNVDHVDPVVRAYAVAALSVQPPTRVRDYLVGALSDADLQVARIAKESLAVHMQMAHVNVAGACERLNGGATGMEAQIIMEHIQKRPTPEAFRALARYAEMGRKELRLLAIAALGRRPEPEARGCLEGVERDSVDADIRLAVEQAMRQRSKWNVGSKVGGHFASLAARILPALRGA